MFKKKKLLIPITIVTFLTGCSNVKNLEITPENNIINKESALQIRDIQVRVFENTTKEDLVTAVVDTLLDDQYFITTIDVDSGIVSAVNNKNNISLNLVSTIKETKKGTFFVRFSISAVDMSLTFKSYVIIQDDTIYRYLFDRLRKSLFLDKEFYKTSQNEFDPSQTKVVEEVITYKKEDLKIKSKVNTNKYNNVKLTKYNSSNSLIYSVQFLKTTDKSFAKIEYERLVTIYPDVRMHKFYEYEVIRLGRFKNRLEAEILMKKLKLSYPEITVVAFKSKR